MEVLQNCCYTIIYLDTCIHLSNSQSSKKMTLISQKDSPSCHLMAKVITFDELAILSTCIIFNNRRSFIKLTVWLRKKVKQTCLKPSTRMIRFSLNLCAILLNVHSADSVVSYHFSVLSHKYIHSPNHHRSWPNAIQTTTRIIAPSFYNCYCKFKKKIHIRLENSLHFLRKNPFTAVLETSNLFP